MPQGFHPTSLCWLELEGTTVKLIWQERKTAFFSRSSSKGRRPVPPSVSLTAPVPLRRTHTHTHVRTTDRQLSSFCLRPCVWTVGVFTLVHLGCVCVCVCVCEPKVFVRRFFDLAYLLKEFVTTFEIEVEKVLDTCNHPRQWHSSSEPAKASLPKAQGMMCLCVCVCVCVCMCVCGGFVRAWVCAPSALIMNVACPSQLYIHTLLNFLRFWLLLLCFIIRRLCCWDIRLPAVGVLLPVLPLLHILPH